LPWSGIKNAVAEYHLGVIFSHPEYGVLSPTEAASWFDKAAHRGYPRAQRKLGRMYELGHGVVSNGEAAVRWYRLAADQGDTEAQCCLGTQYQEGQGVLKNPQLAKIWLRKAANKNLARAHHNLGVLYLAS
jgi:TPR repeat protein